MALSAADQAKEDQKKWEEAVFHFKDAKDVFLGHKQLINTMFLLPHSPNWLLYTGALDGRIIAYDTYDRSRSREHRGGTDPIIGFVQCNNQVLTAHANRVFIAVPGQTNLVPLTPPVESKVTVSALAASDTEVFVGYSDGALRVWAQKQWRHCWRQHKKQITHITVADRRLYTVAHDGQALVWHRDRGTSSVLVEKARRPMRSIVESAGYISIACGSHILVHKKDGAYKTTFKGHTADVHCLAPDRDLLFSGGGDRRVVVWSMTKLSPVLVIVTGHSNRVKCCAILDGNLYTGSGDKTVRVFEMKEAFAQRNEWASKRRQNKSVAKKFVSVFKRKDSDNASGNAAAPAPSNEVTPLQVSAEDLDQLSSWEAAMAQQAEVNKQKEAAAKAARTSGHSAASPVPRHRSAASTSSTSSGAAFSSTPPMPRHRTGSAAASGGSSPAGVRRASNGVAAPSSLSRTSGAQHDALPGPDDNFSFFEQNNDDDVDNPYANIPANLGRGGPIAY
mmetsp:Transcript_8740/g.15025  ORF Transcript_8740/g.15025 Transcript_8740/m.15025 type:complete len:505 (-) Transcript_8740:28-1542(-)